MATQLSRFEPIDDVNGLFTATKGELRCTAIKLRSGDLCLYSPVAGLGMHTKESLEELGAVEFLLAPNHYHNKGMAEYAKAYPTARTVAPVASKPRLERITGLGFEGLDELSQDLPDGMHIVSPPGLKTGEIWLVAPSGKGMVWLVVDAFAGGKDAAEERGETVRLLGTFPKFGVGDRSFYAEWLGEQLRSQPPGVLIPCHGDIVRAPDLSVQMQTLIAGML